MTEQQSLADLYTRRWNEAVAIPGGPVEGSVVGACEQEWWSTSFDVELVRGAGHFGGVLEAAEDIAQRLGVPRQRVVFERGPRGLGAPHVRVTIVHGDPAQIGRWYSGPQVRGGQIEGLGQHLDRRTEVGATMWTRTGMVPMTVIGDRGSGRSTAAAQLVCGAMSTGWMNFIHIDPAGEGSPALRQRAVVSLTGERAGQLGSELIARILDRRAEYAACSDQDLMWPWGDMGGLVVLHEDFGLVTGAKAVRERWAWIVNTIRSLGVWPVIVNSGLTVDVWGDDHTRTACAGQILALRVAAESDGLVPGLETEPSDVPLSDAGDQVAGVGLQVGIGRANMPFRLDWLPDEGANTMGYKPAFTVAQACDTFWRPRPLHPFDVAAITEVLGEPVGGRWDVGDAPAETLVGV